MFVAMVATRSKWSAHTHDRHRCSMCRSRDLHLRRDDEVRQSRAANRRVSGSGECTSMFCTKRVIVGYSGKKWKGRSRRYIVSLNGMLHGQADQWRTL